MAEVTLDFLTTITKIEVVSGVLVLECRTGVGGKQTGVPPMTITVPGAAPTSVFSTQPIQVGKTVLVQGQGLQLTSQTGKVFLVCNLNAIRAQLPPKQKTINISLVTPPGQNQPPTDVNYYWIIDNNASGQSRLFANFVPPPPGGFIVDVWRDPIGTEGAGVGTVFVGGASSIATLSSRYAIAEGGLLVEIDSTKPIDPSVNVFAQAAQLNANPLTQPANFTVVTTVVSTPVPDTTQWALNAGIWKRKKDFILPGPANDIPSPPPAVQPTSVANTGGGPPSKTVIVTVAPPPANTVSFS